MNFAARIVELVHFQGQSRRHDWQAAASTIGNEVPADYRELIDSFGSVGCLDEFLWLHEPDCRNRSLDFVRLACADQ